MLRAPLYEDLVELNNPTHSFYHQPQMDALSKNLFMSDKRISPYIITKFNKRYALGCWIIKNETHIRLRPSLPSSYKEKDYKEAVEMFGESNFVVAVENSPGVVHQQLRQQAEKLDPILKDSSAKFIGYSMSIEDGNLVYLNRSGFNTETFKVNELAYCANLFCDYRTLTPRDYSYGQHLKRSCPSRYFKILAEKTTLALIGEEPSKTLKTLSIYDKNEKYNSNEKYCYTADTEYAWQDLSLIESAKLIATLADCMRYYAYMAGSLKHLEKDQTKSIYTNDLQYILVTLNKYELSIDLDQVPTDFKSSSPMLIESTKNGYCDIVKLLLNPPYPIKKASVDIIDSKENQSSSLIYAAGIGNLEILKLLLKSGADINFRNSIGDTPLLAAAALGNIDIIIELLRMKADSSIRNNSGKNFIDQLANYIISEFRDLEGTKEILIRYPEIIDQHINKLITKVNYHIDNEKIINYFNFLCNQNKKFVTLHRASAEEFYVRGKFSMAFKAISLHRKESITTFNKFIALDHKEIFEKMVIELKSGLNTKLEESLYWKIKFAAIDPDPTIITHFILVLIDLLTKRDITLLKFAKIVPFEILKQYSNIIKEKAKHVYFPLDNLKENDEAVVWLHAFSEIMGNRHFVTYSKILIEKVILNDIAKSQKIYMERILEKIPQEFTVILQTTAREKDLFSILLSNMGFYTGKNTILNFLFSYQIQPKKSEFPVFTTILDKLIIEYYQEMKAIENDYASGKLKISYAVNAMQIKYNRILSNENYICCNRLLAFPQDALEFKKFSDKMLYIQKIEGEIKQWEKIKLKQEEKTRMIARTNILAIMQQSADKLELKIEKSVNLFNQYYNPIFLNEFTSMPPNDSAELTTCIHLLQHLLINIALFNKSELNQINRNLLEHSYYVLTSYKIQLLRYSNSNLRFAIEEIENISTHKVLGDTVAKLLKTLDTLSTETFKLENSKYIDQLKIFINNLDEMLILIKHHIKNENRDIFFFKKDKPTAILGEELLKYRDFIIKLYPDEIAKCLTINSYGLEPSSVIKS